ncbi:MAG: PilZ domain-containing protein [bacterium]
MNVFTELRQEWHAKSPEELLDLSPGVLKKIDAYKVDTLNTVLGIDSVRKMANHPELDWVWRTYRLFRAGVLNEMPEEADAHVTDEWQHRACGEWLRSSSTSLKTLTKDQALLLGEVLGWVTVRDIATDDSLEVARELHRAVTGKPVPPDEEVVKPLKNYFAGSASRYRERLQATGEAREAPHPVTDQKASKRMAPKTTAPSPPPAAPNAAAPTGTGGILAGTTADGSTVTGTTMPVPPAEPPVSVLQTSPFVVEPPTKITTLRKKNYSPSGAYIPKGGGSRGWYKHEGVAKTERGNNYRFGEAIDADGYREVALEQKVLINMRGAERKEVKIQVRFMSGDAPPFPAVCLDISLTGARIRVGRKFPPQEAIQITVVHRDERYGTVNPLMVLEAKVVWCKSIDLRFKVQRYDCGVHFDEMPLDTKERLTLVLTDRFKELIAQPLPETEGEG